MATLIVLKGDHRGDKYPLGHRTNVIGRAASLPYQVLDDRVSRKHLQIRFDPHTGRYSVYDMASKNGVFVNGVRIQTETLLVNRDIICIGNTLLLFTEQERITDESVLHRFKKASEGMRPTYVDSFTGQCAPGQAQILEIDKDAMRINVAR